MMMPDMINLHDVANEGGRISAFIFNAMGGHYHDDPSRQDEVDGESQISLIINGVECPVMETIERLMDALDGKVRMEARRIVQERLSDIVGGIDELQASLDRLRLGSEIIDCFVIVNAGHELRGRLEAVIDGWDLQKAKSHIEDDESKHDEGWELFHHGIGEGVREVRLVAVWNHHSHEWEDIRSR